MLNFAIQFMVRKKRGTILLVLILTFVFALVFSVIPLFEGIKASIIDTAADKYGAHEGIIYNLNEAQAAYVKEQEILKECGIIYNFGRAQFAGSEAFLTLGCFDEEAMQMGHIRILEGRLPTHENEIALEKNALFRMENEVHVGEAITLIVDEQEKEYMVVGFLSNYTGIWTGTEELYYGVNDLPQGIVIDVGQARHMHAMTIEDGLYESQNDGIALSLGKQYVENGNMYRIHREEIDQLRMFQLIFFCFTLVGAGFALYTGIGLYLDQYQDVYRMLFALGAEGEYPFLIYVIQQICLLVASLLLGISIGALFCFLATIQQAQFGIALFTKQSMFYLLLTLVVIIVIMIRGYRGKIQKLRGASVSATKKGKVRPMRIKSSFTYSLTIHQLKVNLKKMIPVILLITLLFSLLSFTKIYFDAFESYYGIDDGLPADFFVNAGDDAFVTIGPASLEMTKNRFLPKKDYLDLMQMEGVSYVETSFGMNRARLLLEDKNDPYWSPLQKDMSNQDYDADEIVGLPQDVLPINELFYYSIMVLDPVTEDLFLKNYPAYKNELPGENEAMLFLPPRSRYEHIPESEIVTNKTLQAGDALRFGYLETEKPFFAALEDISSISYVEHNLTVKEIVEAPLLIDTGRFRLEKGFPVIIISEETFLNSPLFTGVKSIYVYLDENISEDNYTRIERQIRILGSSTDYVQITSLREEEAERGRMRQIVNTSMSYVVLILGIFAFASTFSTQYLSLLQREPSIAIFRALGMKKRQLFFSILYEMLCYLLLSLAISYVLYFTVIHHVFAQILYILLSVEHLITACIVLGICGLVGAVLYVFIAVVLLNGIYRKSINSAMRTRE